MAFKLSRHNSAVENKVEFLQLNVSVGAFEGLDPREAGCRDTMFVVG